MEYCILLGAALLSESSHGLTLMLQENSRSLYFCWNCKVWKNKSNEKWRIVKAVRRRREPECTEFYRPGLPWHLAQKVLQWKYQGHHKLGTATQILQNTKVTTYPIYGCFYPVWAPGNCEGWYDQISVGNIICGDKNKIVLRWPNNGSESLFVATKKKKSGASMR